MTDDTDPPVPATPDSTLASVRADATCIDSGAATAAAARLVTSAGIAAMVEP